MARKKSEKEYLEKFNKVHNNKYTYLPFPKIFNQHTKIDIICPYHGQFSQAIVNHANGMGCPKCGKESMSSTKVKANTKREEYIQKIKERYSNEYDFSETDFMAPYDAKVTVCCKTCHQKQEKRISDLIRGKAGCSFCRIPKMQEGFYQQLRDIGKESFIKAGTKLYSNKYDYSKINYKGNTVPVEVICPIHGSFYVKPILHIYNLEACPICSAESQYSKPEQLVATYLNANNIKYIPQYKLNYDKYIRNKPYDFFIKDFNLLLEVDGPQHYKKCWRMTDADLEERKKIDRNKEKYAIKEHNFFRVPTGPDLIENIDNIIKQYTSSTTKK